MALSKSNSFAHRAKRWPFSRSAPAMYVVHHAPTSSPPVLRAGRVYRAFVALLESDDSLAQRFLEERRNVDHERMRHPRGHPLDPLAEHFAGIAERPPPRHDPRLGIHDPVFRNAAR